MADYYTDTVIATTSRSRRPNRFVDKNKHLPTVCVPRCIPAESDISVLLLLFATRAWSDRPPLNGMASSFRLKDFFVEWNEENVTGESLTSSIPDPFCGRKWEKATRTTQPVAPLTCPPVRREE